MSEVGSRRCVDLDLVRIEKSRLGSGALALLSVEIPDVMATRHLRLYRRRRDGEPFVGGVPRQGPDGGLRRSPLTLSGQVQHFCTALARAELKCAVLEEHDPLEVPENDLWLMDGDHDVRYGSFPRNDRVVFDAIERVDGLRQHPRERGTWIFRLTIAGLRIADGFVIEDCEISDLDAQCPTVLTPLVPRSDQRYAYIHPESALRIAAAVRGKFDGGDAPFGRTGTG
jgi:hypothetical protein